MATRVPQRQWNTIGAGSLDITKHRQRTLHVAVIELQGGFRDVWWSDDGTSSGNSVFAADTNCPMVSVLATHNTDSRLIGPMLDWGPLWVHLAGWPEAQYHWDTYYDSTAALWYTRVQMTSYNHDVRIGVQSKRTFYLHAIGG